MRGWGRGSSSSPFLVLEECSGFCLLPPKWGAPCQWCATHTSDAGARRRVPSPSPPHPTPGVSPMCHPPRECFSLERVTVSSRYSSSSSSSSLPASPGPLVAAPAPASPSGPPKRGARGGRARRVFPTTSAPLLGTVPGGSFRQVGQGLYECPCPSPGGGSASSQLGGRGPVAGRGRLVQV